MAYILYKPTGAQKGSADSEESWGSYITRNVAQVPGRVATGALGLPGDVIQAVGRDIGANKRLKVPREVEENPFLLPGYLEKLREEKQPYQFEEVSPGIGSQQLQQVLPEYLQPREGDYLGEALSYIAPFGIMSGLRSLNMLRSGALPPLSELARSLMGGAAKSSILGAGAYGGAQLGAAGGRQAGEFVGLPETGETLGGALGFGLGAKTAAKGLAYIAEPPTKLIRAADKEGKAALEKAHKQYEAKIDAAEAEFKGSEAELQQLKKELQATHEQRLKQIEQQKNLLQEDIVNNEEAFKNEVDNLEDSHQDIVHKVQEQIDVYPEQVEQLRRKSQDFYNQTKNILNEKYGGDLKVEVPALVSKLEEAKKEGFKSTAKHVKEATEAMVEDVSGDIKNGKISINDAKIHLENLGKRGFGSGEAPIIKSVAKSFRRILHDAVFDRLKEYPELRQSWLAANRAYQEASDLHSAIPDLERNLKKQIARSAQQKQYQMKKLTRDYKAEQSSIKRAINDLGKGEPDITQAIEEKITKPLTAASETLERQKTLASRKLGEAKREYAGDRRGSQAEQIIKVGARRFGPQSLGAVFARIVASSLNAPAGLRELATLGGGAVGYAARIWRQVRNIAKENPSLYKKYTSAVKEAYKGNLGPLANVTELIGAALQRKGTTQQKRKQY